MAKKRTCTKCGKKATYRAVLSHRRFGCTPEERKATRAGHEANLEARNEARTHSSRVECEPLHPPPLPVPLPHGPQPRDTRPRNKRPRDPPPCPLPPNDPYPHLNGLLPIDNDLPPPPRHPDFGFDTPGAGPSTPPPPPHKRPRFEVQDPGDEDDNPATLQGEEWLNGLTAEEYLAQEAIAELTDYGAHELAPGDRLILEAFNFKVDTDITSVAFGKMKRAFPTRLGDMPTEPQISTRIATLAGIQGVPIHCCINSCIAYTGRYADDEDCPECGEARYKASTRHHGKRKPRRVFIYLPLIPRLRNLYRDPKMAEALKYRTDRRKTSDLRDIFDAAHYDQLCGQRVTVGSENLDYNYFSQPTDIALGLSTDGFGPFKSRHQQCWPLIAFNYNLPPTIRFKLEHILCLGVIPGPNSPKHLDTFLDPLIAELEDLARGVAAFNATDGHPFCLRAFLMACFGDMPAVAKIMCMKGHRGKAPCRACKILGVRATGKPTDEDNKTNYVPLTRTFATNRDDRRPYDPLNLPRRSHDEFVRTAIDIEDCVRATDYDALSRPSGIKGVSPLARVPGLDFPGSFPHDFMHAVFQNVITTLIGLWTNNGQFLRHEKKKHKSKQHKAKQQEANPPDYLLDEEVWAGIGNACAQSGFTIPAAFGCRVPDVHTTRHQMTAESRLLFATILAPSLLRNRFKRPVYYQHFMRLVRLINLCLSFSITRDDLQEIRQGFVRWVKDYERLYYDNKPERLNNCTLPIHSLLHIADDIENMGPVWCYWAFPMERYCGSLARAHKSRRFPYASLNRRVLQIAQLSQIKLLYGLSELLDLRARRTNVVTGTQYTDYDGLFFTRPRRCRKIRKKVRRRIAEYLSGLVGVGATQVCDALADRRFVHWGRMQQVSRSAGGDLLSQVHASSIGGDLVRGYKLSPPTLGVSRDASYVKYNTHISRWDWDRMRARLVEEKTTGYGRNEYFVVIDAEFLQELSLLRGLPVPLPFTNPIVLAVIRPIPAYRTAHDDMLLEYRVPSGKLRGAEIIDARDVDCLIGRVKTPKPLKALYIVDRTSVVGHIDLLDDGQAEEEESEDDE